MYPGLGSIKKKKLILQTIFKVDIDIFKRIGPGGGEMSRENRKEMQLEH